MSLFFYIIAPIIWIVSAAYLCWMLYQANKERKHAWKVVSHQANEVTWWWLQHALVADIFSEAWKVISVPDHMNDFSTGGGMVYAQGTMLNYSTLAEMLQLTLEMESERRVARNRMAKLMANLAAWETEHPYGEPVKLPESQPERTNEIEASAS